MGSLLDLHCTIAAAESPARAVSRNPSGWLVMHNRLLVVATCGEVREGARVFRAKGASHERGAWVEGGAKSSNDPISSLFAYYAGQYTQ